jgi:hypothetical protein
VAVIDRYMDLATGDVEVRERLIEVRSRLGTEAAAPDA